MIARRRSNPGHPDDVIVEMSLEDAKLLARVSLAVFSTNTVDYRLGKALEDALVPDTVPEKP